MLASNPHRTLPLPSSSTPTMHRSIPPPSLLPFSPPSPLSLSSLLSLPLLLLLSLLTPTPLLLHLPTASAQCATNATYNSSLYRIAVVVHITNDNSTFRFHEPNATNAIYKTYITTVQPMVAASRLWATLINQTGGLPLFDALSTRIPVHLDFFNAGPTACPLEPGGVCLQRPTQLARNLANASGPYGNFQAIIAPGFGLDPIVSTFLNACEATQSCITVAPLTPSGPVFICEAPFPADCIARDIRGGSRRFQYGFSVLYDGNYALSAHLTIMRQNGILNVAVLGSSLAYGVQAAQTTLDTIASLNMMAVDSFIFSPNASMTFGQAKAKVQQWMEMGVQGVCILSNGADSIAVASVVQLVQAFHALNWLPGAIALGGSIGSTLSSQLSASDMAYWLTAAQWDWHLKGRAYSTVNSSYDLELFPATSTLASPAVFRAALINYTGIQYSDSVLVYGADALQALTFIQKFIELAGSAALPSILTASKAVTVPSVVGQLQLDTYGRTVVSDQLVFQALLNTSRIILSPLSIAANPVLPMPSWSERAFSASVFTTSWLEPLALATTSVAVLYTLTLMLGFLIFRRHPVIKAATPIFCLLVASGGLLMLLSVYNTSLYVTSGMCAAQYWLLSIGFSLMFTALFAKTFRVWRIFNSGSKLKQIRITNTDLLLQLGGVLSFDLILNIVWSIISPMTAEYVSVDPFRPSHDYVQCTTGAAFPLISVAEKGALLVAGISLTYLCRGVPTKFNETPYLAAAIYNCALLSAFMVPLVASNVGTRVVTYAVQVFGVQVMTTSTLSILFVPKFYLIFYGDERVQNAKLTDEHTPAKAVPALKNNSNLSVDPGKNDSGTDRSRQPQIGGGRMGPGSAHHNNNPSVNNSSVSISPTKGGGKSAAVAPFTVKAVISAATGGASTPTNLTPTSSAQRLLTVEAGGLPKRSSLTSTSTNAAGVKVNRLFASGVGAADLALSHSQQPQTTLPGTSAQEDSVVSIAHEQRGLSSSQLISPAAVAELEPASMSAAALTSTSAALQAALARYEAALRAVSAELKKKQPLTTVGEALALQAGVAVGVGLGVGAVKVPTLSTRESEDSSLDTTMEGSERGGAEGRPMNGGDGATALLLPQPSPSASNNRNDESTNSTDSGPD